MSAHEPLGSAAEEAARLADAVHAWWGARAAGEPAAGEQVDGEQAEGEQVDGEQAGPGTCRYCPLCRGVAAVHAVRPEVLAHLLTAAESVAAALRELAREPVPRPHADQPSGEPARPRSVRIPVDDGESQEGQ